MTTTQTTFDNATSGIVEYDEAPAACSCSGGWRPPDPLAQAVSTLRTIRGGSADGVPFDGPHAETLPLVEAEVLRFAWTVIMAT
jgi:hypothetical protein